MGLLFEKNLWEIFLAIEKLLVFAFEIRSKNTFAYIFLDFFLTPESAASQLFLTRLHLAIELWKEDIRECKILATLIMPADKMLAEITDIWMEQVQSQEMAEMLAFNLLQHVEYAPVIAYQWIASDKPLYEIAGFQLLARLFANGKEPNERGINEFLDQAAVAFQGDNMGVKHAAANAVMRFCDFGEDFENIARGALKGIFEI